MAKCRRGGLKVMMDDSDYMNRITYDMYLQQLLNIASTIIEWDGLPPEIDTRFLEVTLISKATGCVFIDDEAQVPVFAKYTCEKEKNIYNMPKQWRAYATGGYQYRGLNASNSVLVFNNYLKTPTLPILEIYAMRLADLQRTIDVNLRAQKKPVCISGPREQTLSLKNLYNQITDNEYAVFVSDNLNQNALSVLPAGVPYIADKLQAQKEKLFNEALEAIGVYSASTKRERENQIESAAGAGGADACRYTMLAARRKAAEEMNRLFGWNVSVHYREGVPMSLINDTTGTADNLTQTEVEIV